MTEFKPKWRDWGAETPIQRTDKTDRGAFVSSVSASHRHIQGENDGAGVQSHHGTDLLPRGRDIKPPETSRERTDKADKSPFAVAARPDFEKPATVLAFCRAQATRLLESSHYTIAESRRLAFSKAVAAWLLAHKVTVEDMDHCATCGGPLIEGATLWLPDGAPVCDSTGFECLIDYGTRRRQQAVKALAGLGLLPPEGWEA